MKIAPLPSNEKERLLALHALLILDTPPEQRFDRITEFAAAEFEVPICLISLVDENRQWFKSRIGIDVCETPRSLSFCAYALHSDATLVVPDTLKDPRFFDHPLVVEPPHLRFYAGAPLVLPSGLVAGTLCLADMQPRQLDALDLSILATLRDLAVNEMLERGHA
ncbi:MAG: GAF domain-containing protein [Rhodocyclaceae bacterium]|nr:GAF domain-containing protein [Rhodocyclaceae bacterium]